MNEICANCLKWRVNDTSEVAETRAKFMSAADLVKDSSDWKTAINSARTSLLLSRGVRSCSMKSSGIYGTGNCAVPEEFSPRS